MHTIKCIPDAFEIYSGEHLLCTVDDKIVAMRLVAWLNGGADVDELKPSIWSQIIKENL